MVEVQDLNFAYPAADFRLSVPELSLAEGETVAVIGPSGSGKTTLLNLLAGILLPASGRIRIGATEPAGLSDAARRAFRIQHVGLVFQDFGLLDYLNALDNILLPYRISRALSLTAEVRQRAAQLAEQLEIQDKLQRPIEKLSQGEKQRVAVCRALLPCPPLILADEPTGNLDPHAKDRVLDAMLAAAKTSNAAVLVVTHDHALLDRFDRVVDFMDFLPEQPAGAGR